MAKNAPRPPAPTPAKPPARHRSSRGRPPTKPRPPLSSLVSHLVRWREAQGLTQEAAAERLGINVNTLKSYEWGKHEPGGANALKIIRLTGYPV